MPDALRADVAVAPFIEQALGKTMIEVAACSGPGKSCSMWVSYVA